MPARASTAMISTATTAERRITEKMRKTSPIKIQEITAVTTTAIHETKDYLIGEGSRA